MEQQMQGIVDCPPKLDIRTILADSKPIILLNTYCKILARIIANEVRPTLSDMLHTPESILWSATTSDAKIYDYNMKFITLIPAFFSAQINGYDAGPLPIQCSLGQLSNNHANIRFGFKFAYKPVRATSYEHQKLDIRQRKPRWWHAPKMSGFL